MTNVTSNVAWLFGFSCRELPFSAIDDDDNDDDDDDNDAAMTDSLRIHLQNFEEVAFPYGRAN